MVLGIMEQKNSAPDADLLRRRYEDEIRRTEIMVKSMEDTQRLLVNDVNAKLRRCRMRTELLRMKYSGYKKLFDRTSILIIVLSSMLAVYETIRSQITKGNNKDSVALNIVPVIVSSIVALTASVLKFQKLSEKMEDIGRCVERAIAIMARLHRVKEEATQAVGMQQLWEIRRGYSTEVCDQYTNCIQSLDLCLKVTDLMTYIPYYARITRELVAYGVEPNDIEGLVTSGRESSTENNSRIKCPCW
ncbi:MAG: hypothetical protein CL902_00725 [Dehalococcoidia bacterium]|nr:hypothetical protein [Dehalococcoidia bacterium]